MSDKPLQNVQAIGVLRGVRTMSSSTSNTETSNGISENCGWWVVCSSYAMVDAYLLVGRHLEKWTIQVAQCKRWRIGSCCACWDSSSWTVNVFIHSWVAGWMHNRDRLLVSTAALPWWHLVLLKADCIAALQAGRYWREWVFVMLCVPDSSDMFLCT